MNVINFGCRLNMVEAQAMRALVDDDDVVIVNSCAVTAEAVREARRAVRRTRRERPDARIVVTGCAAQIEPESFAAMPEVSRVLGNAEKLKPESFSFLGDQPRVQVADIMRVRETAPHLAAAFSTHARAFVEIQNGCDHRCTFCIIPYGRGNSRSVPADLLVDRISQLVDEGFNEVVLTGVDLTSYGADLPGAPTLGALVQRILRHIPDLKRLRLSSLDSVEIDDALLDSIVSDTRVMPSLHLSLQSGDDLILKRMKRRHTAAQAIEICSRIRERRPEVSFGADIIAGFPTETEDMFQNSLKLVEACDIVFGHIFPYSPRAGTPAARMPQIPLEIRKERAARLRAASAARLDNWLHSMIGTRQSLLVENNDGSGHTAAFAPMRLNGGGIRGTLVEAQVTGVTGQMLLGEAA